MKKLNFAEMGRALTRTEMKKIMAGSGNSCLNCSTDLMTCCDAFGNCKFSCESRCDCPSEYTLTCCSCCA